MAESTHKKRLTEKCWRNLDDWECCGQDNYCKRDSFAPGGCHNGCKVPQIYYKLAKYEDILYDLDGSERISFDRLEEICKEELKYCNSCCNYDREDADMGGVAHCLITKVLTWSESHCNDCPFYNVKADRLEEICKAEKEGRCEILPCKPGTVVNVTQELVDDDVCNGCK